ncbi:hypothetical protein Hanom_Chr06g00560171 [Helianthus anomalus]
MSGGAAPPRRSFSLSLSLPPSLSLSLSSDLLRSSSSETRGRGCGCLPEETLNNMSDRSSPSSSLSPRSVYLSFFILDSGMWVSDIRRR